MNKLSVKNTLDTLYRARDFAPTWAYTAEGPKNQVPLIAAVLRADSAERAKAVLARPLCLWAWQQRPLEPGIVRLLHEMDQAADFLPLPVKKLTRSLSSRLRAEFHDESLQELFRKGDPDRIISLVKSAVKNPEACVCLISQIQKKFTDPGLWGSWGDVLKAAVWPPGLEQIGHRLYCEWAFFAEPRKRAQNLIDALDSETWSWWKTYLSAELALRSGDREKGADLLSRLWIEIPWHPNVTLKLFDLLRPPSSKPRLIEQAKTLVGIYTWNKADLLEATLKSLFAADLGRTRVVVLNNGSTDRTREVLTEAEKQRPGLIRTIDLPVNIGAPAARNWILSLPAARQSDFVAFVDDDVDLPETWLADMLDTAETERAAVVGCRIVGPDVPHSVQMPDVHLLPPVPGRVLPLLDNSIGELDFGQFAYVRPCASVIGCCHLLRMSAVNEIGPFDIRFSPTQFDDLDHDLRTLLHGGRCIYNGLIRVRHVQRSSLGGSATPAQNANMYANKLKLEAKYRDRAEELLRLDLDLAWNDLMEKSARLRAMLL